MTQRPLNKKGPHAAGGGATGEKKVVKSSVAAPRATCKLQPPKDPILRALWRVCSSEDLSNQERLGLLILWRLLGPDEKPIGASLFAKLLNTSYARAKNILTKLQQLNYITSDGHFSAGLSKRARRAMTRKAKLPTGKTRHRTVTGSENHDPAPLGASDPAPLGASDLGVGQGGRPLSAGRTPANEQENQDDNQREDRTISIADLVAADAPVKSRTGEGAA